jgi:hypothetical protein
MKYQLHVNSPLYFALFERSSFQTAETGALKATAV